MKWVDIPGYEGFYQINEYGKVKGLKRSIVVGKTIRCIKERLLKTSVKKEGYCFVRLSRDGVCIGYRTNRLVAIAFIPNPFYLPEVNHKDGNKKNNHLSNLEWVTKQENIAHSWAIGLRRRKKAA